MTEVYFREHIEGIVRGILRAMLNSGRSDDYKAAALDFAASLSDSFGIGVVDELGDLVDIGRFGSGGIRDPDILHDACCGQCGQQD